MADLGNVTNSLTLQCKPCGLRPAGNSVMEALLLHNQVEHDTSQVELDLVAVCTCGAAMEHTETRPTGGGFKDYVRCPACENTGFVKRSS